LLADDRSRFGIEGETGGAAKLQFSRLVRVGALDAIATGGACAETIFPEPAIGWVCSCARVRP
jgi:hypothetical protein